MTLKPINTVGGFRLHWRSAGEHVDPAQTQRVIGKHVYVFRSLPDRIDVWRSDMADAAQGYRWTRVHTFHGRDRRCVVTAPSKPRPIADLDVPTAVVSGSAVLATLLAAPPAGHKPQLQPDSWYERVFAAMACAHPECCTCTPEEAS